MSEASDKGGATAVEGPVAQSARIGFTLLFLAVGLLALAWVSSNVRRVPADSRAEIFRLGAFSREQGPGLMLAWPRPIERVVILPAADRQIEFHIADFGSASAPSGRPSASVIKSDAHIPGDFLASRLSATTPSDGSTTANPPTAPVEPSRTAPAIGGSSVLYTARDADARRNAGFLLTGDAGIVHFEATLFYRIADGRQYVLSAEHVGPALQRVFASAATAVGASRGLDGILVARPEHDTASANAEVAAQREQLRGALVDAVNRRLADLASAGSGFGIVVTRVDLTASLPESAKAAFDKVLDASQTAEQAVADARTFAAKTAQIATQARDKTLASAQAAAEDHVNQAKVKTAGIAALASAPEANRAALLDRIYRDRVAALLAAAGSVTVVDPREGAHLLVPGPNK
jgi:regulator of protease activity HflC (stomatin/prohibitin superfamily)